jgi:hypothetical protein
LTYSVNITATNQVVNVTNTSTNVVVSDSGTIIFTVTTTSTNVVVNSTLTNVNAYYDAVELRLNNLNTFWKGVWTTSTYNMGDLVNYKDSVFLLKDFSSDVTAVYTSTVVPPSDTTYWTRIVWHEAPFDHVTVTNALVVGTNASIGGSANITNGLTVGANLQVNNTATVSLDAIISRDLSVGRNATVTGSLTVGPATANGGLAIKGPLYVDGISEFTGTATFDSTVLMPYSDLTARNITSNQRITANNLVVSTTATLNGLTTLNGLSNFNAQASFNSGITANVITATNRITAQNLTVNSHIDADSITARYGLYSILQVNETGGDFNGLFELNGLIYPLNRGLNGQVLSTNGTSNAYWVNLSDLNYWNLSTDLTTNAHNIITGVNSSTGLRNNLSLLPGTTNDRSSINLTDDGRVISLISKYYTEGSPTSPPEIDIYSDGIINIVSGYNLSGIDQYGSGILIKARKGSEQSLSQILVGSARTIGGVGSSWNNIVYTVTSSTNDSGGWVNGIHEFQGGNIRLTSGGTGIQFPDGSIQYSSSQGSTGTYSLPIASGSTLGGIKVGSGLSIDGSGVLSATGGGTGTISAVVGNNPIYVTTGSGIARIYLNVGANLSVDSNGFLNAFAGTSTSYVSLGQDMLTNGYKIKTDNTYPGFINVDRYGVRVEATTYDIDQELGVNIFNTSTGKIYINGKRGVDIIAGTGSGTHPTTSQVNSIADYTRLGTDNNHSDLGVNRIRNYAFSGPPLFPNGIQFDDQTIQITAYDDGRFNFGNITPPFNRQSWQDLITQLLGSQGTITTPNTGHWTFGPILI